ncbi:MAG TPA: HNH endonuclease signature motif containing protein [Kineosporiaceae bacterium]
MPGVSEEDEIRAAALRWVAMVTRDGQVPVTRAQLAGDFVWRGRRFPLVDRGRGIRRPAGWMSALSIVTAVAKSGGVRPYDDAIGPDGLHRYKLRRDVHGRAENEGLRNAMVAQVPLLWFYGEAPGVFQAIFPVFLVKEEPLLDQFVLAPTTEAPGLVGDTPIEGVLRRYLVAETRRRLHQPLFAGQVMMAYRTACAVCSLRHRELLDAAHIVPDVEADGLAVVSNGLALCKIHHAAYDSHILGIRPDLVVEIRHDLLAEIDGPMLRHGLQEHHGHSLMRVPERLADRPDPDRLERRYARFRAA